MYNGPLPARYQRAVVYSSIVGRLCMNMPNASTMLSAYQRQIRAAAGAGLAGLETQARLSPTIRALLDVVDDDHDPRR